MMAQPVALRSVRAPARAPGQSAQTTARASAAGPRSGKNVLVVELSYTTGRLYNRGAPYSEMGEASVCVCQSGSKTNVTQREA